MSKNEMVVKAKLPLPVNAIAHRIGKCECPVFFIDLLEENPAAVEENIGIIIKEVIRIAEADVRIRSLKFSHIDSKNVDAALAYFTVIFSGRREELGKVFGDEKISSIIDR